MRRGVGIAITLLCCLIIQVAVLPALGVTSIAPDLILAVLVPCAVLWNSLPTALMGAAAGLIIDILFGNGIGLYSISYLVVPWFIGQYGGGYFHENPVMPSLMAAAAFLLREAVTALLIYLGRMEIAITAQLLLRTLASTLYTGAFTAPVYLVLFGIINRQTRRGINGGVVTFGR